MSLFRSRAGRGMLLVGAVLAVFVFDQMMARQASAQASDTTAKSLKVYVSVDMEGVAGVVTADQLIPGGFEYERFRH
ncbi:MAG: M55 family metallopeptidase, partial [Candidatus Acidiferrum sp.]